MVQLGQPIGPFAFPTGVDRRQQLADGSEILLGDFDHDRSRVSAIVVAADGLLTRVSVASAHSTDVSGWPTTTTGPDGGPHTPAARSLEQVATVARALVPSAAGR
jgi:hypothetical protein